jgi:hypothetical protein
MLLPNPTVDQEHSRAEYFSRVCTDRSCEASGSTEEEMEGESSAAVDVTLAQNTYSHVIYHRLFSAHPPLRALHNVSLPVG